VRILFASRYSRQFLPRRAATPLTLDWVSAGNNVAGIYYVSPYTAEIKNTGQFVTLYCIDFNHEVAPPLNLASVPSTEYGTSSSNLTSVWIKYEAAAWLITQLTQADNAYQKDIDQFAAWKIFLDPAHIGAYTASVNAMGQAFGAQVTAAYDRAFGAVANGYTPTGWDMVTPDPAGRADSTQEFLTPAEGPFAPTPEPLSVFLLGSVLLGFACLARWRKRSRRARV
jgi:hypothetical protein